MVIVRNGMPVAKIFENKEGGQGVNGVTTGVTSLSGLNQWLNETQNEESKRYLSADSAREKRTPQTNTLISSH